jgi:hypothetical protein
LATVLGGQKYAVDNKGNVFKNNQFVPAEKLKYIPSQITDEAKKLKLTPDINRTIQPYVGGVNPNSVKRTPESLEELMGKMNTNTLQEFQSFVSNNPQKVSGDTSAVLNYNKGGTGTGAGSGGNTNTNTATNTNISTNTNTATNTATNTNQASTLIDQLTKAQRDAQIAALAKSRDQALSNLSAERSAIQPKYYDARNQAAAGSQQQARNFAEFMAARGGVRSGANAQASLMNNMTLQGNLGALGRQEAQAYTDIERRQTDALNDYANNVAGAEANIQSNRLNLLLGDYYKAQERGDRLKQLEIENEFRKAGLTGMFDGQRTLQGQQFDRGIYESDRNFNRGVLESDRSFDRGVFEGDRNFERGVMESDRDFELRNAQITAELTGYLPDGTKTNAQQQQELKNLWTVADATGVIGAQLGRIYGIPANTQTLAGKQLALSQQSALNSQNNAAQNQLMDVWRATGVAPAGIKGVQPGTPFMGNQGSDSGQPAVGKLTANQFIDSVAKQFLEPELDENKIETGRTRITTDPLKREGLFWAVISGGYDDATTSQLLRSVGITTKEESDYINKLNKQEAFSGARTYSPAAGISKYYK